MKKTINFLLLMLFVSCGRNETPDAPEPPDPPRDKTYCEQLFDTAGLKLYPFVQFTNVSDPNFTDGYTRQIPEEFLHEMTTEELFYQYFYDDYVFSIIFLHSTYWGGFYICKNDSFCNFNVIPELLNRPDVGQVILEILKKIDLTRIKSFGSVFEDCMLKYRVLFQVLSAQPEVVNSLTDEEIEDYIFHQLRCYEAVQELSTAGISGWSYPGNKILFLFALGNVMVRYEFEPFMQLIEQGRELYPSCGYNGEYPGLCAFSESSYDLIIDFINNFKNR